MKTNLKNWLRKAKVKGMTLTELLVVLAIIGILTYMAVSSYKYLVADTHSVEAQNELKFLCQLEKTYYLQHSKFSADLKAVNYEQNKMVSDEKGSANYKVEIIQADKDNFSARATSITDFDGDGVYNVWEVDKDCYPEEIIED